MKRKILHISFSCCVAIAAIFSFSGCGIYSFTGAKIPAEAETVSVDYFQNMAPVVMPTLSATFTDALKDRFTRQTKLSLVRKDGDLAFEGEIRDYTNVSMGVTGNEVASKQRLTVTVKVVFTNRFDKTQNFDKTFSRYAEYDSRESLASVERTLVEKIVEELVDDIFNASVANWD